MTIRGTRFVQCALGHPGDKSHDGEAATEPRDLALVQIWPPPKLDEPASEPSTRSERTQNDEAAVRGSCGNGSSAGGDGENGASA